MELKQKFNESTKLYMDAEWNLRELFIVMAAEEGFSGIELRNHGQVA